MPGGVTGWGACCVMPPSAQGRWGARGPNPVYRVWVQGVVALLYTDVRYERDLYLFVGKGAVGEGGVCNPPLPHTPSPPDGPALGGHVVSVRFFYSYQAARIGGGPAPHTPRREASVIGAVGRTDITGASQRGHFTTQRGDHR